MKILLLSLLAISLLMVLGACQSTPAYEPKVQGKPLHSLGVLHDDVNNVTCWYILNWPQGGLTCMPDKAFK